MLISGISMIEPRRRFWCFCSLQRVQNIDHHLDGAADNVRSIRGNAPTWVSLAGSRSVGGTLLDSVYEETLAKVRSQPSGMSIDGWSNLVHSPVIWVLISNFFGQRGNPTPVNTDMAFWRTVVDLQKRCLGVRSPSTVSGILCQRRWNSVRQRQQHGDNAAAGSTR